MTRWLLSASALLALASVAPAQTFQPGALPDLTQVTYQPVNLSQNLAAPVDSGNTTHSFNFANLFRRIFTPSAQPTFGVSNYPSPSTYPSTRYPNYFQPRQPIIPSR